MGIGIVFIYSLFFRRKRYRRLFKREKKKCWKSEFPLFEKKVKYLTKNIKYSKNIDILIKNFDTIKEEFDYIMQYKPFWKDIEFNNYRVRDTNLVYLIRDKYIKDTIDEQIEIELKKREFVDNRFLKEGFTKKATFWALKGALYFPEDSALGVEYQLKINELEQGLMGSYKGG